MDKVVIKLTEEEANLLNCMLICYGDGGFVSNEESDLREKIVQEVNKQLGS